MVNSRHRRAITVPAADGKLRFWRNTARREPGGRADRDARADGTLGYEWDEDLDNGVRPAGLIRLSLDHGQRRRACCTDYGLDVRARHRDPPPDALPRTRAARSCSAPAPCSGRGAWTATTTAAAPRPTRRMQQATVNLFADMGVQPATLQAGLLPRDGLDRHDRADLDDHLAGRRCDVSGRHAVTITGTATDAGGGVVGGVEVSVDGGATWHPAAGRATWTYTWTPRCERHRHAARPRRGRQRQPDRGRSIVGRRQSLALRHRNARRPDARGRNRTRSPRGRRRHPARPGVPQRQGPRCGSPACPPARDCRVRLRLRLDRRTIAKRTFTVKRGGTRRVTVKLDRAARRKLVRKGSLRVTAVVTAGDRTTRTTIRLLAPKEAR